MMRTPEMLVAPSGPVTESFFDDAGRPARVQPAHVLRERIAQADLDSEDDAEVSRNSSPHQIEPIAATELPQARSA